LGIQECADENIDNCIIFDPSRTRKIKLAPSIFTESYNAGLNYNSRILESNNNKDLIFKEIKFAFDKFKIAYV